jgi:hypothetical protein
MAGGARGTSGVGGPWLALVLALAVGGGIAWAWTAPIVDLTFRSTDDSYYYFNVARNIVLGHGVSFDGINPTNGFHPLWMLCILPVFALARGAPETGLRAVFSLVFLLAGLSACFASGAAARAGGRNAGLAALLVLAFPVFLNPLLNGLESGLLVLLLLALIAATLRWELLEPGGRVWRDALLGALLAGVFLARLDSVFQVLAVLGALVVRWARARPRPAAMVLLLKLARVGGVMAVLVMPYLLWNLAAFGHLVPISGGLKSSFPHPSFALGTLGGRGLAAGLGLVLAPLIALAVLAAPRGAVERPGPRAPAIAIALWVGSALHLAYTFTFMTWGTHWWYSSAYVPAALVLIALGVASLGTRFTRFRALVPAILAVLGLGAGVGLVLDARMRGSDHRDWYEAAIWARRNLPADAVIAMPENGLFGYFCGRPVVNLDGVINGYAYQRALRDHALRRYLDACGVTYVADYRTRYEGPQFVIPLPARLYRQPGGALLATREAEVYTSHPGPGRPAPGPFRGEGEGYATVIWALSGVTVLDDETRLH